ncbi:MAG: hypothetical protein WEB06_09630 [Actinomycetota bacterium]
MPWSADFVMQAIEILAVAYRDDRVVYLKPEHADSFIIGWPAGAKPEAVSLHALARLGLEPIVLHSTSWRHAGSEAVLTYLTVVSPAAGAPPGWIAIPVGRAELARGDTTAPPPTIGVEQVLEHALRHLAWLVKDDPAISATLPEWREVLSDYTPEPFRALGGPPGA